MVALPGSSKKGEDVSDWINAGGTAEELVPLVERTPVWEPSAAENSTYGRILLGKAMIGGVQSPEELVEEILLAGRVHSIYSGPGMGKTFLTLWLILRVIEQGLRVLLFDQENGPRIMIERLKQLGADPEQVDELLHYCYYPDLSITQKGLHDYGTLLDEVGPALVVFDSWIDFLAANDLDENSSNDIATFAGYFLHPARRRGIATLQLDHVPHEAKHARGSTRKKDEVDVMWSLSNPEPFDRNTVGRIVLNREKDREAWLPEKVELLVGGSGEGFVFERSAETLEDKQATLKHRERKALAVLEKFGQKGATDTEWQEAAEKAPKEEQMTHSTFYRAKSELLRKECVLQVGDRFHPVGATDTKEVPRHQVAPGPKEGATGATTLRVAPGGTEGAPEEDEEIEQLRQLLAETKL